MSNKDVSNWQNDLRVIRALISTLRDRVANERDTYPSTTPEEGALCMAVTLLDIAIQITFQASNSMRIREILESN